MSAVAESRARSERFTPYLVGAGLGVLSWNAFAVARDPRGVTTALSRVGQPVAALAIGAGAAAQNSYWRPMPFSLDYGVLFLAGAVFGAVLYALSFDWAKAHFLALWAFGKLRLPGLTGVPDIYWFAGLAIAAVLFFVALESRERGA